MADIRDIRRRPRLGPCRGPLLRAAIAMVALVLCWSGCTHPTPPTSPALGSSPVASTPSAPVSQTPSIPASHDLFTPGLAQQVIAQLVTAADDKPVIRVVLDRTRVRLTYVEDDNRPHSMVWLAGVITPSDDGTDLADVASFDPTRFNLGDIRALFDQAAELSGSAERQELQITEYDRGQILMTITTTPESSTIFFDHQGNLIPRLDVTQPDDLARALSDVAAGRVYVVSVGVESSGRVWADFTMSPGVLERRIRPATMPMYRAQRRETPTTEQFAIAQVDPAVLAGLLKDAPAELGQPPDTAVTLVVTQPTEATSPEITITVGNVTRVSDSQGNPVTGS